MGRARARVAPREHAGRKERVSARASREPGELDSVSGVLPGVSRTESRAGCVPQANRESVGCEIRSATRPVAVARRCGGRGIAERHLRQLHFGFGRAVEVHQLPCHGWRFRAYTPRAHACRRGRPRGYEPCRVPEFPGHRRGRSRPDPQQDPGCGRPWRGRPTGRRFNRLRQHGAVSAWLGWRRLGRAVSRHAVRRRDDGRSSEDAASGGTPVCRQAPDRVRAPSGQRRRGIQPPPDDQRLDDRPGIPRLPNQVRQRSVAYGPGAVECDRGCRGEIRRSDEQALGTGPGGHCERVC